MIIKVIYGLIERKVKSIILINEMWLKNIQSTKYNNWKVEMKFSLAALIIPSYHPTDAIQNLQTKQCTAEKKLHPSAS